MHTISYFKKKLMSYTLKFDREIYIACSCILFCNLKCNRGCYFSLQFLLPSYISISNGVRSQRKLYVDLVIQFGPVYECEHFRLHCIIKLIN